MLGRCKVSVEGRSSLTVVLGRLGIRDRVRFVANLCYMRLSENDKSLRRGRIDYNPIIQKTEVGGSLFYVSLRYVAGSHH